jgi:hypothetical protein
MSLFRANPATCTATGKSAVQLQASRTAVRQHHRRTHRSPLMTNTPTEVRTSTPTLMYRRFSGGCPRTWPPRPCCCTAARSQQPRRSDECASS